MRSILVLLLLMLFQYGKANDSLKKMNPEAFLQIVKRYHPVARQASINVDKALAELTASRGGFDPVLGIGGDNKTFDGINYYRGNYAELNIPTWYGIEIKTGVDYLGGTRNNPRETIGQTNYVGISVPLAKNLLMDKRRAALKQARIMVQASEEEKKRMLNDLLMEAGEAYWKWVETYFEYQTYSGVIKANRKRFNWVVTAWRQGERPAIDTTEALVQLQEFEYRQNEARLAWQNAGLAMSAYLWDQFDRPYDLTEDVVPGKKLEELFDAVDFPELEQLATEARKNHPELSLYAFKLKSLNLEKKLKFQELLPKVDLKYNQLGKGYNIASTMTRSSFTNNYNYGIGFSLPLRFSNGRGEYRLARLKIAETRLQQNQKELLVTNKVRQYYNHLLNYRTQVNLLQRSVANYRQLQRGEEIRFFNGESSLFLVNSRETRALEQLLKLTETTIAYNKAAMSLAWAGGRLWK